MAISNCQLPIAMKKSVQRATTGRTAAKCRAKPKRRLPLGFEQVLAEALQQRTVYDV
jgi:hypothetical protein